MQTIPGHTISIGQYVLAGNEHPAPTDEFGGKRNAELLDASPQTHTSRLGAACKVRGNQCAQERRCMTHVAGFDFDQLLVGKTKVYESWSGWKGVPISRPQNWVRLRLCPAWLTRLCPSCANSCVPLFDVLLRRATISGHPS